MSEAKTVLVSLYLTLLVEASFCIYQVYEEKKVEHHSESKSQVHYKNENKKSCLNSGDCYYLVNEGIVGCNCPWL